MRTLFFNGNVLTQDINNRRCSAFIVEDGKFMAVGDTALHAADQITHRIDLQGKTVLPGYHDAHIHVWKVGNLLTNMLDLRGVKSMEEMQQMLLDYANAHPEQSWIQARGFNEADFPDKRMPNKLDLDHVIADRPVVVTRTCAHQIIVNSAALQSAQITRDIISPAGGEIKYLANGSLAGHFTETAIGLVLSKIPKYSSGELRTMVLAAQDAFLKAGITAATDPAVDRDLLEVYKQMDRDGALKIRLNAIPIRVPDGANKVYPNPALYSSKHLTVNTVKYFADGGLSGKTAAVSHPYKGTQEHGVLRLQYDTFRQWAVESQHAGFIIATHAIGDAAIDLVLRVYRDIADGTRHRIEHLGLPTDQHLDTMRELGTHAVMQPIFIKELGKNFMEALDVDSLMHLYPVQKVLQKGINLALSTDAPVVRSFHPHDNIRAACDRQAEGGQKIGPEEAISAAQAIYAYTMGSAVATESASVQGSITPSKFADFQVFTTPDHVTPEAVYTAGNPV